MMVEKKYLLFILFSGLICEHTHSQHTHPPGKHPVFATQGATESTASDIHHADSIGNREANRFEEAGPGYGSFRRAGMTGAVTVLSDNDLNTGLIHDPMQLIQGRVSGLNIVRPGGDPNEDFIMRLRGLATSQQDSQPLLVIDDFVGASLLGIDPSDVSTFVILRDAASAALYGARGANGVILITTKTGKAHKPTVHYNTSAGVASIARRMQVMTASEYRAVPGKPDLGGETDWMDAITRTAAAMVHNLAFSGGSDNTTYRASVNYRMVDGILINSGFSQINTRAGIRQSAFGKKAIFTLDLSRTTRDRQVGFPIAFRYAIATDPTMPLYDNTTTSQTAGAFYGGYAERNVFDFYNPLSIVKQNKKEREDVVFSGRIGGVYDFSELIKGLSVSASFAQQRENTFSHTHSPRTAKFGNNGNQGHASKRSDNTYNRLFESFLYYKRSSGNVNFNLMAGYTFQKFFYDGFGLRGGNFLTDAFTFNNMGAALDFEKGLGEVFSYAHSNKLEAAIASAGLDLEDTYFFALNARYDGSSRFGANQKRGIFPGASVGILLNNVIEMPAMEVLRIRAGYGVTGNQPDRSYASLAKWDTHGLSFQSGQYRPGYGLVTSANPALRWEAKKEVNLGFDMVLNNPRLKVSYNYFYSTVDDLVFNVAGSPDLTMKSANVGKLENRGFELYLSYEAKNSERLRWTTGLNIGKATTKVVEMSKGSLQYGYDGVVVVGNLETVGCGCTGFIRIKEGELIGEVWGPVQTGVGEDGRQIFADISGDGGGDGYLDRKTLGNTMPDLTLGFSNRFIYGNFSLNLFLRGAFGHHIVNNNRLFFEGQGAFLPYNIVKSKYYLPHLQGAQFSDHYLEKAGYIKLDNITLAYNWPFKSGSSITQLQLYASAQNLFTLTPYTGLDPEVRYYNAPFYYSRNSSMVHQNNPLVSGLERTSTYPATRTFSVGVTLKI